MEYRKKIYIKNKIIKIDDLMQFAKIIEDNYVENDYIKKYVIKFENDSEISSKEVTVFDSSDIKRNKTESLCMEYWSGEGNNRINIVLNHIVETYNFIEISSEDETWYHSTISKFQNTIDQLEKQKPICKIDNTFSPGILCLVGAFFPSYPILMFISDITEKYNIIFPKLIQYAIIFIIVGLSIFLACKLLNLLIMLYPKIEFNFGENVAKSVKRKKESMKWVATTIIIPLILFIAGKLIP